MFLAPGAQICPNCQLNLTQIPFQQQAPHHHVAVHNDFESKREKSYRMLLTIFVFFLMGEFFIYRIVNKLSDWFGMSLYSMLKPLNWLGILAWGGFPLVFALMLPKKGGLRIVLIVLASLYALWHIGDSIYTEFFYSYDDYEYSDF